MVDVALLVMDVALLVVVDVALLVVEVAAWAAWFSRSRLAAGRSSGPPGSRVPKPKLHGRCTRCSDSWSLAGGFFLEGLCLLVKFPEQWFVTPPQTIARGTLLAFLS